MKKNKGISLIILVLLIVVILVIGAVTVVLVMNKDNKSGEETKTEETNKTNEIISNEITEGTTGKTFWINSMDWSKKSDHIELFNDKISLPINLENLDVCSAPYSFFPNGVDQTNADTIQEILKSTTKIQDGGETRISTQIKVVDGRWKDYDEVPDNIDDIYIKNYNETDSTIAECYNNGWWYITSQYNLDKVLGVDLTNNEEYMKNWDESPLLDMAIDKLGSPTYIRIYGDSEDLKLNDGTIQYELVYEYEEYTITIIVMELIMSENDSQMLTVGGISYYTKECWEKDKNETAMSYEIIRK